MRRIRVAASVRPGMDLSKVVLPTFILEPRSFLEKLTDFFGHIDLLAKIPTYSTPEQRMFRVVQWYLSGFYLGPRGVKKPYNPILGTSWWRGYPQIFLTLRR